MDCYHTESGGYSMTGLHKPHLEERITPEEAVALFQYATAEDIQIAKAFYDEYRKQNGTDKDTLWDIVCLVAFAFDTGRVQGLREARARKRSEY